MDRLIFSIIAEFIGTIESVKTLDLVCHEAQGHGTQRQLLRHLMCDVHPGARLYMACKYGYWDGIIRWHDTFKRFNCDSKLEIRFPNLHRGLINALEAKHHDVSLWLLTTYKDLLLSSRIYGYVDVLEALFTYGTMKHINVILDLSEPIKKVMTNLPTFNTSIR